MVCRCITGFGLGLDKEAREHLYLVRHVHLTDKDISRTAIVFIATTAARARDETLRWLANDAFSDHILQT